MKHYDLTLYNLSRKWPIIRKVYDTIERSINKKPAIAATNQGWSFVIVSAGSDLDILEKCIASIYKEFQSDKNFEIIIVGPKKIQSLFNEKAIIIPYIEMVDFPGFRLPGWITHKKNIGVQAAKFNKVVLCHDYISLDSGWKKGFENFGDDFDICVTKVFLKDGRRTRDWMTWDYPGVGPGLLPYFAECTQYQYINGTYVICKRDFYLKNPLDESMRWGEAEDIEWSKRIRSQTKFKINTNSSITYLKDKPSNAAPYCESWIANTKKLSKIFGSE